MTPYDLIEQMMYKEKYKHIIEETQEDQEEEDNNITQEELQEILQQITETLTSNEDTKIIIQEHEKSGIPPSITALTLATHYQTQHIILTKYISSLQDIADAYKEQSKQLIQESIKLTTIKQE